MFALRFAKTGRALAVLVLPILAQTLCLTPQARLAAAT